MSAFLKSILALFCMTAALPALAGTLNVTESDVSRAVAEEFAEQGLDEDLELEFFGGKSSFAIENAQNAKIMTSGLKYDETQNKFSVRVEIFADGRSAAISDLQGKYYVLDEAWVPVRNINKGETLAEQDLKSVKIRRNRLKPSVLSKKEQLVEKEAKRSLKEGKLINEREVGSRILVRKGDIVTLVYKSGQMQITAKGEALNDGAKNQKIEAENTKSKKKVYGIVKDADTVEVNFQ